MIHMAQYFRYNYALGMVNENLEVMLSVFMDKIFQKRFSSYHFVMIS